MSLSRQTRRNTYGVPGALGLWPVRSVLLLAASLRVTLTAFRLSDPACSLPKALHTALRQRDHGSSLNFLWWYGCATTLTSGGVDSGLNDYAPEGSLLSLRSRVSEAVTSTSSIVHGREIPLAHRQYTVASSSTHRDQDLKDTAPRGFPNGPVWQTGKEGSSSPKNRLRPSP
jgi:hypothetical protein